MKRVLILLLTSIMLLSMVLTGCGSKTTGDTSKNNSPSSTPSSAPTSTPGSGSAKPITLNFYSLGALKAEVEYMQDAVKEYKEKQPNVNIEVVFAQDSELNTKMNVAFASGSAPDIIYTSVASTFSRIAKDQIEPLEGYLQQWGGKNAFFERSLQLGTYKNKLYAIGLRSDPRMLFYRKDYFQEAGLDPNKPPKTWEEFADYAVKLTKKENGQIVRAGADIPTVNGALFFTPFVVQNGGAIADEENDKLTINSPQSAEALQFVGDLYKKGVSFTCDGNKMDEMPFTKGKSAMSFINSSTYTSMINKDPSLKEKIGITDGLQRKNKAIQSGLICLSITKDSKYKKEAADFVGFLLSEDQTWKRYQKMGTAPVLNSLKDKYVKENPILNQAILDANNVSITRPRTSWAAVYQDLEKTAYESVVVGNVSAKDALATLETNLNKAIKK